MPKKKIPSYRLHKPTGRAVVTLNRDGKREDVPLGKFNSKESWAKYQEVIAEYLADNSSDAKKPPIRSSKKEITIEEAVPLFLEYAEGYYLKNGKPTSTLSNYQESLVHIVRWYGKSPIIVIHLTQVVPRCSLLGWTTIPRI